MEGGREGGRAGGREEERGFIHVGSLPRLIPVVTSSPIACFHAMFPHCPLHSRRLRYAEAADNRHVCQPLRGKHWETSGREAQDWSSLPLPVTGNCRGGSVRKLVNRKPPHEHSMSSEGRRRECSPSRTADELRER